MDVGCDAVASRLQSHRGRVAASVQGRRAGCEPPLNIADARAGRRSLFRNLAMDRHRRGAADGLRVAKGHLPFAADGSGLSAIRSRQPLRAVGPRHVSAGTTDHAIPWSRLRDEAPNLVNGGERMPGSIVSGGLQPESHYPHLRYLLLYPLDFWQPSWIRQVAPLTLSIVHPAGRIIPATSLPANSINIPQTSILIMSRV